MSGGGDSKASATEINRLLRQVRVERRGKSSPIGSRVSDAVNSIRSNTGMGAIGWPDRSRGGWSTAATRRVDR